MYSVPTNLFVYNFDTSGGLSVCNLFYLEMHKLQQCKDDYITAFLVSSRSPVLLADDTSGIVRSIPKNCHNNGIQSRFSRIANNKNIND